MGCSAISLAQLLDEEYIRKSILSSLKRFFFNFVYQPVGGWSVATARVGKGAGQGGRRGPDDETKGLPVRWDPG
jgi:hypothetical protein